jgi:hypothetical protein
MYSGTAEKLLYEIGQGSCSSPILRALLNQLILTALVETFECIIIVSINKIKTITRPGDSFVDNTTIVVTSDDTNRKPVSIEEMELTEDEEELVEQMQVVIHFFLDLLQVIAGDLAPEKCVWYLIARRWNNGLPTLLRKRESCHGIEITSNATGQTSGIKRKSATQGHITLGFHLTGDITSSAHKKIMKCKAKEYGEAIIISTLNREEGLLAYNTYYMASFLYGTAATSLDIKECEEIQRPVVNVILPKMGINRNITRSVVFGTSKYDRIGLDHLTTFQGFGQLQCFIGSLRTQDTTYDLYQMLLEYTQLECGTAAPILEENFSRYEHAILTKNWITECWRYLSLCNASVPISGLWAPTKVRLRDMALMDEFTRQGLSDKQMRDANRFCIYLRAFYISDITDLGGKSIEEWAKQGKRQATRTSKWKWPVQQRPLAVVWKNWQMSLQCITSEDGYLFQHLGPWGDIKNSHQNT